MSGLVNLKTKEGEEMKKEFMAFVKDLSELTEGKEIALAIRDLAPGPRKYDCKIVKAVVASSPEKLPEGDVLRIRSWTGVLHPKPWAIKILAELDETLPGRPHDETLS
jgi:hypothetical protein